MSLATLQPADHHLLNLLQTEIPLVPRPFAALAEQLGLTEDEALARTIALKGNRIIRQISAIFDSKALGYESTLVAAKVAPEHLEHAVAVINAHPGVSHNYLRNHAFNLWYTLAVPPDSKLGLEKTLDILHRDSGAISTRMLPTLKLFKIGVKFDLGGTDAGETASTPDPNEIQNSKLKNPSPPSPSFTQADRDLSPPTTPADKLMIRILQQDLPLVPEPFAPWATEAGGSVDDLLAAAKQFLARKQMRRFSAVLRHREAGISANAMGVWAVPQDQIDAFGTRAASFPAVSHCYLRKSYPDWPYTMFTMVHAPTQPQCEQALAAISQATGITDYSALYSSREFKKVRVKYFLDDIPAWEAAHA
jgi:DNA-binding Lrp family transcriptional regulator